MSNRDEALRQRILLAVGHADIGPEEMSAESGWGPDRIRSVLSGAAQPSPSDVALVAWVTGADVDPRGQRASSVLQGGSRCVGTIGTKRVLHARPWSGCAGRTTRLFISSIAVSAGSSPSLAARSA